MNYIKSIFFIIVIFIKTGNVLSKENIFDVNNVEIIKNLNFTNQELANQAIKKGFEKLKEKILLEQDLNKLDNISPSQLTNLVKYYQVINDENENNDENKIIFNIFFDKEKLHNLFFEKNIFYSEISDKEVFLLPVIMIKDQVFVYNNNLFYEKWNEIYNGTLIEFIIPIENIEVLQKINLKKDNILDISLKNLFPEYEKNNLAFVIIDYSNQQNVKIYLKTNILGKSFNKNLNIKNKDLNLTQLTEKIVLGVSKELINLVKSKNLIDVRTPSFINTKLLINRKSNLVELNKRLEKIDSIENIFVQEFNNEYVLLKIKYLGKLEKIMSLLKQEKVILKLINDQWSLQII